jgi:hypothetical protein
MCIKNKTRSRNTCPRHMHPAPPFLAYPHDHGLDNLAVRSGIPLRVGMQVCFCSCMLCQKCTFVVHSCKGHDPESVSCDWQKTEDDQVVHVQSFDFRYYPMHVHAKRGVRKTEQGLCMYPQGSTHFFFGGPKQEATSPLITRNVSHQDAQFQYMFLIFVCT